MINDWAWCKSNYKAWLFYNVFLLLIQLAVVFLIHANPFRTVSYPASIYIGLFAALGVQILLCILLSAVQTAWLWGVKGFYADEQSLERWQGIIFVLSIIAILSTNYHFFPLSTFSRPFNMGLPTMLTDGIMYTTLGFLLLLSLLTLWRYARFQPVYFAAALSSLLLVIGLLQRPVALTEAQTAQTNLIIIGVDSLSPEYINPVNTPNLSRFLNSSVHFKEVISPLARTTPAWTSILTGLYALNHGARENLYPVNAVRHDASFAWNLKSKGYRTLFASDDRRFNSISLSDGFDHIVGPHVGIYDFILGTFYDFPLSNFLINTSIAKWLIPYNYDNRASYFSYYTTTFDRELQAAIIRNMNTQPLFLAVHFTLPHWPYAWAPSASAQLTYEFKTVGKAQLYNAAVHQADEQIGILLAFLEKRGMLNNSMLIVLSDHGEALYTQGSRKTAIAHYQGQQRGRFVDYLKQKTATDLDKSGGHGSDLLSPSQFQCLLGFKIFKQGHMVSAAFATQTPVALIDIAPTIADFFHLQLKDKADGISLLSTIQHQAEPKKDRMIMMESGMLPNQNLDLDMMMHFANILYRVNPSSKLVEIKNQQFAYINTMKLYGMKYNEWLLALYPDDHAYIPVLVNVNSGDWSDDPASAFVQSSPFAPMLRELRQFYKQDLALYPRVTDSNSLNN